MAHEQKDIEIPKPLHPFKRALIEGGIGAVLGGALSFAWQKSVQMASKVKEPISKTRMLDFAMTVGLISTFIGYVRGQGEQQLHGAVVDNVTLHKKIHELETENQDLQKSFVKYVTERTPHDRQKT